MLILEDLGFRVAVFVIFLVFPAIFFVLRRKWRISVARKEEIDRLVYLASEEAARAEFEASFGYSSEVFVSPVPAGRVCVVCFTPTTNRCARCKAVHYCSGKCQIIHWRLGHKDECHPSVNSPEINDEGVSFMGDSGTQFHFEGDIPFSDNSGNQYDQVEIAPEKRNITPSAHNPPKLSINDDKSSVHDPMLVDNSESHADYHIISDSSEPCSSSSDGTCIDDSVSDVDSVHELDADSCDSFSKLDNVVPADGDRNEEQSKPLEEEPYSGVPSNNDMFVSSNLKDKASSKTIGSSGSTIIHSDKNISIRVIPSSGFWDGSLDYCRFKKDEHSTDAKPDVGGSGLDLYSRGLEASSPAHAGISNTEVVARSTITEKDPSGPTRNQSSTILVSKEPVTKAKVVNSDKHFIKSGRVGVTDETTEDSAGLPSSASEKAKKNDLEGRTKHALHSPVSKRVGVSPKAANGPTSGMKEPNSSATRSVKAVSVAAVPSAVAQPAPSSAVGMKTSVLKVVEQFRPPRLSKQSDNIGKNIEKAVFPYEVFVKLYHWNKVELRPCGLINCGNSCYANAILQCLAFTPPLTAYLLQGLHSKACMEKEWCFLCEFERLILKAKEGGSPLSPIGILSQIHKIGSHLANGREEDAHEFLRYAIDTMQSTCLQNAGANAPGSLYEETTLMGLTFGGYLRSKIKCTRCRGKSEKQERMMDLTVEISGDIETLEEALRKFTGTEPPFPSFLSGKFGKLNKTIQFPEILNLAPYMRGGSDKSPIYRLYGVVVHLDIMNEAFTGHYVCYVRNSQNKWYKIDDSMVKAVELESVLTKGAYMLFYSRVSPRAPRSIRSAIVCHDFQAKTKIPEVGPPKRNESIPRSRHRDASSKVNRAPNGNVANINPVPPSGTSFSPVRNILDFDSSSDSSSLFSHSDDVSSSTTDSNRDSISADDLSEYFFGNNAFFRHSSDSDTSSSSSSSSSPEYTKHSPLSNPERYSSALPDDNTRSNTTGVPSQVKAPRDVSTVEQFGSAGGIPFLHSNSSSNEVRKLVNISSSRESDVEKLGRSNPSDNGNSHVHLRRTLRTKAD